MYSSKKTFDYFVKYVDKLKDMMPLRCKICHKAFSGDNDDIILCRYQDGAVHFNCCINQCSKDRVPCKHCVAQYTRISDNSNIEKM